MADLSKRGAPQLSEDNDPFAELTRIMGRDTRPAEEQPGVSDPDANDPFDIDLEKELLGGLDGQFEPEADVDAEPAAAHDAAVPAESWDAASGSFEQVPVEEAPVETVAEASTDIPAAEFDDAFAGEFEDETSLDGEAAASDDDEAPTANIHAHGTDAHGTDAHGWEREPLPAPAAPLLADDSPAVPPAPEAGDPGLADVDMDFGDLDFSEEAGEAELYDTPGDAVGNVPGDAPGDLIEVAGYGPAPEPAAPDAEPEYRAEPSLEDELGMLLAEDGEDAAATPVGDSPSDDGWRDGAADNSPADAGSVPYIPLYGRANYSPAYDSPVSGTDASGMAEEPTWSEEPAWDDGPAETAAEAPEHDEAAPVASAADWLPEPAAAASEYDEAAPAAAHGLPEPAAAAAEYDDAAPAAADWSPEPAAEPAEHDEAASVTSDTDWSPEPAADPFAVFSTIAPADAAAQSAQASYAAAPADEPEREFGRAQTTRQFDAATDFETVEVPEAAVAMRDDLDLPEPAFDDEPPLAYEDYDAEFSQAFGEMGEPAAAHAGSDAEEADDRFFETLGLGGAGAAAAKVYPAAAWQSTAHDYAHYGAETDQAGDASDLERDIDVAAYGTAAAVPFNRRRSGIVVAAVVLGVAILGGLGAFALAFGGGDGDDAPALVQAGSEPLKVKPENPGGTSVPNQDSKAYERVAGLAEETAPAQERLVTTAEEPVDLTARAEPEYEPENMLPGVDEDILGGGETEMAAKSEERLEKPAEVAGVGATEDLAAVQPRRVRTMIVRPDGTLVPREDPTPAQDPVQAPNEPAAADAGPTVEQGNLLAATLPQTAAAAIAAPAAEAIREVSTQPALRVAPAEQAEQPATSAEPAAAPPARASTTPATGPIAPSRPTQQPTEVSNPPAARQQQQVAQAAPAPARNQPAAPQPAATAEWSMQIASQPTAEGAQATYQDLARRYGGVIGGRGVNIVRADIPGKGTYYRVRIPSATRADAVSLCEKYKASGGSCFVSK